MAQTLYWRVFSTAGGWAALVVGPRGLRRSFLPRRLKKELLAEIRAAFPETRQDTGLCDEEVEALLRFYRGEKTVLRATLDMTGLPPFHRAVYRALRKVKWGQVTTYSDLARAAGSPAACRAVGGAMGRNPFPPFVPCHRVLGTNGSLVGFTADGGVDLKRRMLQAESFDV